MLGIPAHVMQRGHNCEPIFFNDADYIKYLKVFKKVADQFECKIHAYVLMTNHVHFLLTPARSNSIGLLFQNLGREYVTYVNKTYQHSGTLWGGRHKGCIIDSSHYFLRCMQYIELNPVRAETANHPGDYAWSSYRANALGAESVVLIPHDEYLSLAAKKERRVDKYRQLLAVQMEADCMQDLTDSLQSGTPLGGTDFNAMVEKALNHSIGLMRRGRPKLIR
jgi:putative transposase